jgi:hypothetical protein
MVFAVHVTMFTLTFTSRKKFELKLCAEIIKHYENRIVHNIVNMFKDTNSFLRQIR